MQAGENVMLMWTPVPGAAKYKIYKDGKEIGESIAPTFTVPLQKKQGVHKYTIAGIDSTGEKGPVSKEGILTPESIVFKPDFEYRFEDDLLNITWKKIHGAVKYDIYKAESKQGLYKLIASVNKEKYIDSQIKESESLDNSYYYKIIPKDKFNKTRPDTGIHKVKIWRSKRLPPPPDIPLMIMRSKQATLVRNRTIKSVFDAKFYKDKETMVYTDPMSHVIAVINKNGDRIRTIGKKGPRSKQFGAPFKLGLDEDDNIYVTDSVKERLFAYGKNGKILYSAKAHIAVERSIMKHYDTNRPFWATKLGGVVVYGDKLYIAEKESGTIQLYNKADGKFRGYLKNKETKRIKYFPKPVDLLLDKKSKKLYIGCSDARKVIVVDIDTGEGLYEIGRAKTLVGAFESVSGMAFDKNRNLIVADRVMHTVQVFSKDDGKYMYHIGDEKAIPDQRTKGQKAFVKKMKNPSAVNMDKEGRLWIYVGGPKAFMVRSYIDNKPWDVMANGPER
jgi:DNA-binding beta-propeller fold protein YncE